MAIHHGKNTRRWSGWKYQEEATGNKKAKAWRKNMKKRSSPHSQSRQTSLASFVKKHKIACFRCGDTHTEWAKTGISQRGPWAICVPCVKIGKKQT